MICRELSFVFLSCLRIVQKEDAGCVCSNKEFSIFILNASILGHSLNTKSTNNEENKCENASQYRRGEEIFFEIHTRKLTVSTPP